MKKHNLFSLGIISLTFFLASCGSEPKSEPVAEVQTPTVQEIALTVDTANSKVLWKGEMLGLYSHDGLVKLNNGTLQVTDGKITAGTFEINLKTMVATDANYDAKKGHTAEKLIQHLSSPDFFAVDSFPTATFTITGNNENGLVGKLKVRGIEKEEMVKNVTLTEENGMYTISGEITFNRRNYNVSFTNPVKEKVLSDDIQIKVNLSAKA